MEQPKITTLAATGSVSSRFVSASELDEAKKAKEEQWRAAYARLGQEPPPKMEEEEYDPRTLYEKLSLQKEAKREQWDEKMKMSNQWRGLEADELEFLAEVDDEAKQKEREKEKADRDELAAFKARQSQGSGIAPPLLAQITGPTQASPSSTNAGPSTAGFSKPPAPKPTGRSNLKAKLKGVVVKKKEPAIAAKQPPTQSASPATVSKAQPELVAPTGIQYKANADPASKRKRAGGLAGIASGSDTSEAEDDPIPSSKKPKVD